MICALARKEGSGELSRGGSIEIFTKIGRDVAAGRIAIVPFGDDVVREAAKLVRLAPGGNRRGMIRALDLIHLASAVAVRSRSIVTTDARLRELAALAGMEVLPERPY
jgi:predicted nucleic acid-binding protein